MPLEIGETQAIGTDREQHPRLIAEDEDPEADLSSVASVASFFISRVDSEVDKRLQSIGSDDASALRGKAAVAQGKLAYQLFLEAFSGARWEALAARGSRRRRGTFAGRRPSCRNVSTRPTFRRAG